MELEPGINESIEKQILLEDNHLIVVNKLPGQIVQGDKTGDEALNETIKNYIKKKYGKPGDVYLGVVHRLDRPVSGVVIFARTSKALSRLNEMLKKREIKKVYWAIVKNRPPETSGHLINHLYRDQEKNKTYVRHEKSKNTKEAELYYTLIKSSDQYHLLEVELLTGRHHQIRAQLSHTGCPVKGDIKYGFPRINSDGSIHLHARLIEFKHPVGGKEISLTADPPDENLWNFFIWQT